jgi:hypothetical protein
MNFTKIPADTFQKLQLNAGILLKNFTPSTGVVQDADIIGATSGGMSFRAQPTFTDFGADVDNAPKNTKELKHLDDWTVTLGGTLITMDANTAKLLAAAADVSGSKVTPRVDLEKTDFSDLWWVGDHGNDKGFIAIHLINALSTGGFQIQSADKAKGKFSFEFTAHFSMDNPNTVPFEIYVGEVA